MLLLLLQGLVGVYFRNPHSAISFRGIHTLLCDIFIPKHFNNKVKIICYLEKQNISDLFRLLHSFRTFVFLTILVFLPNRYFFSRNLSEILTYLSAFINISLKNFQAVENQYAIVDSGSFSGRRALSFI